MFNFFKPKSTYLYAQLKPVERIEKLFAEYVSPALGAEGYTYLKSQKSYKKKNALFDFYLSWSGNKYNQTNTKVAFDLALTVKAPSYRKWEQSFYNLNETVTHPIDSCHIRDFPQWSCTYHEHGWYDLAKSDNRKVVLDVKENMLDAGLEYFDHFKSYDSAISLFKKYPIANLELIVDFYLLQDRWQEAHDFFEANKQWHETEEKAEGHNPDSQYVQNRKIPYELRKKALIKWKKSYL